MVHLHSHKALYNICAHNSLPTSAILVLGLLKKKEEDDDEQFCVGSKNAFLDIWHFTGIFDSHKLL